MNEGHIIIGRLASMDHAYTDGRLFCTSIDNTPCAFAIDFVVVSLKIGGHDVSLKSVTSVHRNLFATWNFRIGLLIVIIEMKQTV